MLVPAFGLIMLFQLLGEGICRGLGLPFPGPLMGMVLMALGLWAFKPLREIVTPVAQGLLRYISLFFVPAGVGVIAQADVIRSHWLALTVALVVSVALTLVATAWTFRLMMRWMGAADEQ